MLCIHSRTKNAKPNKGFQLVSVAHLVLEKPRGITIIIQHDEQTWVESKGKKRTEGDGMAGGRSAPTGATGRTEPSGGSFSGQPGTPVGQVTASQQLASFSYHERHPSPFNSKKSYIKFYRSKTKGHWKTEEETPTAPTVTILAPLLFLPGSARKVSAYFPRNPSLSGSLQTLAVPEVSVATVL